ncbi:MAG TPA: DDE-type integrase/transposase/recombinase [Methanosarcina sp.]|nr:DDE-type integrase/transposase/recombinase [Methanosarcina sp.]
MNEQQQKEQIALFRYSILAPIITGQVKNVSEYFRQQASKVHQVPFYGPKEYLPKTFVTWLSDYRHFGFDGLKPQARNDKGTSRALSRDTEEYILNLRKMRMDMPLTVFYDNLIANEELLKNEASFATIYRLLKRNGLVKKSINPQPERKRFSHEQVNFLWQGDTSDGPFIPIHGKKGQTFLFAFIDDCSRLVTAARFLPDSKFESMREVLKEALLRRGIPKIIYVDNGKIYRSQTLSSACASLGISLAHTQPYDAASKGKIERFFKTVQTRFYPLLKVNPASSLEELNMRFLKWLEEDYHRKPHSSLEKSMTPLDKFISQASLLKMVSDPDFLNSLFLVRAARKVHHDGTISVNNRLYEVPARFIGCKIEIRFDDTDIFVYEEGSSVAKAKPVIFSDNAFAKRESKISYAIAGGHDNV